MPIQSFSNKDHNWASEQSGHLRLSFSFIIEEHGTYQVLGLDPANTIIQGRKVC